MASNSGPDSKQDLNEDGDLINQMLETLTVDRHEFASDEAFAKYKGKLKMFSIYVKHKVANLDKKLKKNAEVTCQLNRDNACLVKEKAEVESKYNFIKRDEVVRPEIERLEKRWSASFEADETGFSQLTYAQKCGENRTEATRSEASTEAVENDDEVEEGDEDDDAYQYHIDRREYHEILTDLMFVAPASLTMRTERVVANFGNCTVRLMKGNLSAIDDQLKSYLLFSTPDVPSLHYTRINKDTRSIVSWETNVVTVLEENWSGEKKVIVQFEDKETCKSFYTVLESIQGNDASCTIQ